MGEPSLILAELVRVARDRDLGHDLLTFVHIEADGTFAEAKRNYRQLWENGQRLAAWMHARGMRKGDTFAIVMQNHPEFVDLMVAASILGAVFVPIWLVPSMRLNHSTESRPTSSHRTLICCYVKRCQVLWKAAPQLKQPAVQENPSGYHGPWMRTTVAS